MQHDQIIKTLEKLIPEGVTKGPENVLLKYASENNLAPAQLERLAQMYNVAMTLNFMDKSANRGGSFDVIDVPDLLAKFTDPADKQASIPDDWSAWLEPNMNKAASTFKVASSADDFISMARGIQPNKDIVFEEDYEEYKSATTPGFWDSLSKEAQYKFEVDSVKQLLSDAEEDFRKAANSIKELVRTGADFREMAAEAQTLHGEDGVKAARAFHSYLSPNHNIGDLPGAVGTRIVKDTWKTEHIFKEAAEALSRVKAANDYLAFLKEGAKGTFGSMSNAFNAAVEKGKNNEKQTKGATDNATKAEGRNKPKNSGKQKTNPTEGNNAPKDRESIEDSEEQTKPKKNRPNSNRSITGMPGELTAGGAGAPIDLSLFDAPLGKGPEGKEDSEAAVQKLMGLAGDANTGVQGILDPETYTQGMSFETHLNKLKGLGSGKNQAQKKVDQAALDARDVTTVQRLMMTDPIISKADPEMVVSLANTLAKASPQVRQDPNLLRMALREAIQYEAIPIHTFKDLVEMEQRSQSTQETRSKNEDKRYNV